ncbi:acyltransferase family protein [Aeromicrobium endophyticum]|uniref:Acyltransferase n=1 Tax=Aeromicrobium endophyticum TaxID=2292704 RepID=A0A371P4G8_9ACTN|nr:acyltransferase family protein [Aeromicrobium endophyticum]REK70410.1 acyltransferase [Aeromicrobium endophyticum]
MTAEGSVGRRRSIDGTGPVVGGHRLRTDVQGLRALAVTAVVLYHLWPNRLSGGFVGVDVFFVISGFLITGHLLREIDRTGSVRLARFWAARARRLLPASLLVLTATAVAVLIAVPRSLQERFLSEVLASAFYVQNWKLAGDAVDYLAADNRPSASQHFWSLSVEEQFYVFLPLLVLASAVVARRLGARPARVVLVVLVLVTTASFAYCLHLTSTDPGIAYFSTFTRMWEFGLGGLASFAPPALAGLSRRRAAVHTALTLAGGAAVVAAMVVIDGQTPFPGSAAVLPVLGATAIVRWGGSTLASWVGALPPVALLGRISYALYLWHWPLIVMPPLVTLTDLTTTSKLVVLAVSVVVAWASTRFFEEPVRFRVAPRVRPVAVLGAVLVAMVPVVLVAGLGRSAVQGDDSAAVADAQRVLAGSPRCLGAAAMDPDGPPCDNPDLDGVVVPDPAKVADDTSKRPGCWATHGVESVNVCSMGPQTGYSLHLLAVGDSHNLSMVPAYEKIAEKYNWRIDLTGHAACYWTTADLPLKSRTESASCAEWRSNLQDYLDAADDIDAVLATNSTSVPVDPPEGQSRRATIVDGLVEAWSTMTRRGVPVVAVVDNPAAADDTVQCVERYALDDPDRCATPRSAAFERFDGNPDATRRLDRTALVDMTDFYCTARVCPAVIGSVAVHRDRTHVTKTYMASLAPYLGREIERSLRSLDVL